MKSRVKGQGENKFGRGDWRAYFQLIPKIKLPWLLILFGFILDIGYSEVLAYVPVSTSALFSGEFTASALVSAIVYNLLSFGLMIGSLIVTACVSKEAIRRAQGVLWKRMMHLDMVYYDENDPSNLISTITNDTETAVSILISQLISMIPTLYYLVKVFITINGYDVRLLISVLVLVPLNVAFVIIVGRWRYEVNAGIFRQVGSLTAYLAERVSNLFLIKSYTNEELETKKGLEAAKGLYFAKIKGARVTLVSDSIANLLDILQRSVPIVFGVYLLKGNYITMEQWIAFFLFISQIINQVDKVISMWSDIKSAQGSAARMIQIINAPEEKEIVGDDHISEGDLTFNDVTFSYTDRPTLKNINFSIPAGKTTALVGRSGSGKSTIMGLIERLYNPDTGSITLDGKDVSQLELNAYRDYFAYVQQDAGLFGGTIRSAMTYGLKDGVTDEELRAAAAKTGILSMVEESKAGFDGPLAISGRSVSGGQRQRIVLTRELIKNRPCLLLDEPTSALDAKSAYDIQKKLMDLFKGHTMLMITHDLRLLSKVEKIIYLEEGEIIDSGSHKELIERCTPYRELVSCGLLKEAAQ